MNPVAEVGADVHRPRGEQHVAQPGLDAGEHRLELASAMHDHRARELRENLGADLRRARNEERPEFGLSHARKLHRLDARAMDDYRRVSTRPANTLAKRPSSMVERSVHEDVAHSDREQRRLLVRGAGPRSRFGSNTMTSANAPGAIGPRSLKPRICAVSRAAALHRAARSVSTCFVSTYSRRSFGNVPYLRGWPSLPSESGDDEVLLHELLDVASRSC